jgi:hypothetical protein
MIYPYRLCNADSSDAGKALYAVLIAPGEMIHTCDGRTLRVLEVVPTAENPSEYIGLLRVETWSADHGDGDCTRVSPSV